MYVLRGLERMLYAFVDGRHSSTPTPHLLALPSIPSARIRSLLFPDSAASLLPALLFDFMPAAATDAMVEMDRDGNCRFCDSGSFGPQALTFPRPVHKVD